jgi:hypothetical protein
MTAALASEFAAFWPVLLVAMLLLGGIALLLAVLTVEAFLRNYTDCPPWMAPQVGEGDIACRS